MTRVVFKTIVAALPILTSLSLGHSAEPTAQQEVAIDADFESIQELVSQLANDVKLQSASLEEKKSQLEAAKAVLAQIIEEKLAAVFESETDTYELRLNERTELLRTADSTFRWANPLNPNFSGALYVWTEDSRPVAISGVWSFHLPTPEGKRRIAHEFVTLANEPVTALRSGKVTWRPEGANIKFKPIPGAPVPATIPAILEMQLRSLASQFHAVEQTHVGAVRLETLLEPVYSPQANGFNGGIFAMLLDYSDPEAFLVIDERESPKGLRWEYAIVRFGLNAVTVTHNDQEVWSCEVNSRMGQPDSSHFADLQASTVDWVP